MGLGKALRKVWHTIRIYIFEIQSFLPDVQKQQYHWKLLNLLKYRGFKSLQPYRALLIAIYSPSSGATSAAKEDGFK